MAREGTQWLLSSLPFMGVNDWILSSIEATQLLIASRALILCIIFRGGRWTALRASRHHNTHLGLTRRLGGLDNEYCSWISRERADGQGWILVNMKRIV